MKNKFLKSGLLALVVMFSLTIISGCGDSSTNNNSSESPILDYTVLEYEKLDNNNTTELSDIITGDNALAAFDNGLSFATVLGIEDGIEIGLEIDVLYLVSGVKFELVITFVGEYYDDDLSEDVEININYIINANVEYNEDLEVTDYEMAIAYIDYVADEMRGDYYTFEEDGNDGYLSSAIDNLEYADLSDFVTGFTSLDKFDVSKAADESVYKLNYSYEDYDYDNNAGYDDYGLPIEKLISTDYSDENIYFEVDGDEIVAIYITTDITTVYEDEDLEDENYQTVISYSVSDCTFEVPTYDDLDGLDEDDMDML